MIACPRCRTGLSPDSRRWIDHVSPFQGPWEYACLCGMLIGYESGEVAWREVREAEGYGRFPSTNRWEIWEVMRVAGREFHVVKPRDPYRSWLLRGKDRRAFVQAVMDRIAVESVLES